MGRLTGGVGSLRVVGELGTGAFGTRLLYARGSVGPPAIGREQNVAGPKQSQASGTRSPGDGSSPKWLSDSLTLAVQWDPQRFQGNAIKTLTVKAKKHRYQLAPAAT